MNVCRKNVVSIGAWVLAVVLLSGGAVIAAESIAPNSVHSRHIEDGTIRGSDLNGNLKDQSNKVGPQGEPGQDGVSGYQIFTSSLDFGPGGEGGAWCGAPNANTEDQGWVVLGGGAELSDADIDAGVAIAGSWPHEDALNPGWTIQLNKVPNHDPGTVDLYVVCAKIPTA